MSFLTSESVEGTSLSLKGIDNIHSSDSLPLGVFSVGDSIPDNILKENLENTTGLLIDQTRDTLDSSTTSQPSDCGLGDTLDVVSQHLPVTLSASLSKSLSSFASSSHVALSMSNQQMMWICTEHRSISNVSANQKCSIPRIPTCPGSLG